MTAAKRDKKDEPKKDERPKFKKEKLKDLEAKDEAVRGGGYFRATKGASCTPDCSL